MSKIRCNRTGAVIALLALAAGAVAAPEIDLCIPANITPSQFDLVVRTSEPAVSWVEVYADPGGVTNLSGVVGMEVSPITTGDPSLGTSYERRADQQAIQDAAAEKGLALHRISGCDPSTIYYYRVQATNAIGTAVWPTNGLLSVATELENDFVLESRQLLLQVNPDVFDPSAEGALGVLSAVGASGPIASFIGDGVSGSELYFDLSSLFSDSAHVNMALTGTQEFEVVLYGSADEAELTASFSVSFSDATEVALASTGLMAVPTYILDIRSIAGMSVPAPGIYTNDLGSVISCSVTNTSVITSEGVKQVLAGWSLDGAGGSSGSEASLDITVSTNLVLTWNWDTKYWLDTGAGIHGQVDEPDQWVDAGSVVTITATPDQFYHTDDWSGDLGGTTVSSDGNQIDVPMSQPRSIFALFAENTDANGVPQRWFYDNGLSNAWESVGIQDADGDGMLTWQEWVAGTSPVDIEDVLALGIQPKSGRDGMLLAWPSTAGCTYRVWRSTNLIEGFVAISDELSASPPVNTFIDYSASENNPAFYRISIESGEAAATPVLEVPQTYTSEGRMELTWPSVSGRVYTIWRSTELGGEFESISDPIEATPPTNSYTDAAIPDGTAAYYRISVEKP
ncbi:MAG: hypothetical protein JXR40_03765 [Pontiellaceae bacterium]|nr:hypothetical protein [Pontiellaceae bacterium]